MESSSLSSSSSKSFAGFDWAGVPTSCGSMPRGESDVAGEDSEAIAEWGEVLCKDGEEEEAVKGAKKSKGAAVVGGGARGSTFDGEKSSSRKLK